MVTHTSLSICLYCTWIIVFGLFLLLAFCHRRIQPQVPGQLEDQHGSTWVNRGTPNRNGCSMSFPLALMIPYTETGCSWANDQDGGSSR